MKYKILIDKNTIIENPNAGKTELIEQLSLTINFAIECHQEFCSILDSLKIDMHTCINPITGYKEIRFSNLTLLGANTIEDLIKNNKELVIGYSRETKNNFTRHQHYPESNYLFAYQDIFVVCQHCHAQFNHKYLKTEDEYDNHCYTVCPICEARNCCEVEYQDINEAIKEMPKV